MARQVKASLWARLSNQDWLNQILWVLLGQRAAPKEDCELSTAEMVYGNPLFLGSLCNPCSTSFLQDLRERMTVFQPPLARALGTPAPQISAQSAAGG
jgi:hypothetical protein